MKNKKQIKALLERYFAGETTLAEEQTLRQYFTTEEVPPEWSAYRDLFGYFAAAETEKSTRDYASVIRQLRPRRRWLSYAAAVLLLLAATTGIYLRLAPEEQAVAQTINWEQYEPADERAAAQLLNGALKRTANTLQDGFDFTAREVRVVESIGKPLKKTK
ncbi:MAG: hypothetical protein AAGJ82_13515, partial [Bacteroidota bacterium]